MLFLFFIAGNAIRDSYYPMDNYINIVFYILACFVVFRKIKDYWLPVICIIAAFNRETAILIPLLFFLGRVDFSTLSISKKDVLNTAISSVLFLSVFFGIRLYYGELGPTDSYLSKPGLAMLKLNFLSMHAPKTYFEWIGTFSLFPMIAIYYFKNLQPFFKKMLLTLVPIWFAAHLWLVVAWETRIYLIPMLIVLLPAALQIIEQKLRIYYQNELKTDSL